MNTNPKMECPECKKENIFEGGKFSPILTQLNYKCKNCGLKGYFIIKDFVITIEKEQ